MLKKVFIGASIVIVLFSCKNESISKNESIREKKPGVKIIANSPALLEEFLLKTAISLKNHIKEYQDKGEFETAEEYYKRHTDWEAKMGIGDSIQYKATGLFPVEFGEYDADRELFSRVYLKGSLPDDSAVESWRDPEVAIMYESQITGVQAIIVWNVRCPREKARLLRTRNDNIRCDIVFTLDYTLGVPSKGYLHLNWNYYKDWMIFWLHYIKFYSLETGDILFEASSGR